MKPKRVSHVDEHESEHVEHEEYTEQDDDQSSEGDPQVDFAALAIDYNTIDTRYNPHHFHSSSESSDDDTPRRPSHRK
jgi:hypothetical protein